MQGPSYYVLKFRSLRGQAHSGHMVLDTVSYQVLAVEVGHESITPESHHNWHTVTKSTCTEKYSSQGNIRAVFSTQV